MMFKLSDNGRFGEVSLKRGLALLTAALLACCLRTEAQSAAGVDVWSTTSDRASLFAQRGQRLAFRKPDAALPVITIEKSTRFQAMDGFGFALTGGSAGLLMRMSPARRKLLLMELFGTEGSSIGVSYLRVSIGASDMNERVFTYDDLTAGQTDPGLQHFSLGPDLLDVVPVLREILAIQPNLSILASPWTAPSWMKTNGLPKGGNLEADWYQAYAKYFVKYLRAMQAQGIRIRAVTMQNEPLNPKNTPSMVMTAKEQTVFLATALGPALLSAGLATEVILYDHNCDRPEYPLEVLADPAAAQFATGSGFHLYGGTIDAMTMVHDTHPDKGLYFTEQMTIQTDNDKPLKIAESTSRLMIEAPRNWSRNILLWNLAADPRFGPHTGDGGCPVCQGAITVDGDQVTRNLAYYTVAQAARFVRPGSVRVASESQSIGMLPNVAFTTPNGGTVLLVANTDATVRTFDVKDGVRDFQATLGPGDVATYVWQ